MHITDAFDGGNIIVLSADTPQTISLEIRKDNQSDFHQWFSFRLTGARHQDCVMRLTNAGSAAYATGWEGYRAVASYDRVTWFRVDTEYDGTVLTIRHRPERDAVHYAYFAPYSMERHADLIAGALGDPRVTLEVPGRTLDGQDMDVLAIGDAKPKQKTIWVTARQHPGETMAEWFVEGFLQRLLDRDDPVSRRLLDTVRFFIVPNMNPDGSRRGHLRTNAAGVNLNRAWVEPSMETSPEVFLVRNRMMETGVDLCLDVHGDEVIPYNFIVAATGIPSLSKTQQELTRAYKHTLAALSPDFQTEHGYPRPRPGKADLRICTNWIAEHFGCLAMTLEQPFKDTANNPEPVHGWSPERAKILGRANLDAMLAVVDRL